MNAVHYILSIKSECIAKLQKNSYD